MNARDPDSRGDERRGDSLHTYDGIVEHDNKLPLWWQLTLYGAVIFALIYWFGGRFGSIDTPAGAYAKALAVQRAAEAERERARGTIDDEMLRALSRDPSTKAAGRAIFVVTCAPCHRADGGGNIGPNLTDRYWIHGGQPMDIFHTITDGVPARGMPTWGPQLGQERVLSLTAFVMSLEGTNVPGGKAPQGELARR